MTKLNASSVSIENQTKTKPETWKVFWETIKYSKSEAYECKYPSKDKPNISKTKFQQMAFQTKSLSERLTLSRKLKINSTHR